jgi:hypothetical protein
VQRVPANYRTALIDCLAAMLSRSWQQQRDRLEYQTLTSVTSSQAIINEADAAQPEWSEQPEYSSVSETSGL